MGISFSDSHGSAKKNDLEYVKLNDGINEFRMVGELRPRYAYWKKLKTNSIPVECLSFDPKEEKFTNTEKDWFRHYFPEDKCVWSYVVQVIDSNNELKLCGLKKKLFEQIQNSAKKLGDPTDPEEGWPIIFEKKRTGSHAFNVEYILDPFACAEGKGPLTDAQKVAFEKVKPIDELITRPTPEDQKAFIEQAWINVEEKEEVDQDAVNTLAANSDTDTSTDTQQDVPF